MRGPFCPPTRPCCPNLISVSEILNLQAMPCLLSNLRRKFSCKFQQEADESGPLFQQKLSMLKLMLDASNKATHLATATRFERNLKTITEHTVSMYCVMLIMLIIELHLAMIVDQPDLGTATQTSF